MALNPDIIIAPVVTEKSAGNAEKGIYTFKVVKTATKIVLNTCFFFIHFSPFHYYNTVCRNTVYTLNFCQTDISPIPLLFHRQYGIAFILTASSFIRISPYKSSVVII